MTVVTGFSVLSGNTEEIILPALARSLRSILDAKQKSIDRAALDAAVQAFLLHETNTNNPHRVILGDLREQLLDLTYTAYVEIADVPLSRTDFDRRIVDAGRPLLDLIRRIMLNGVDFIDGYGPKLTGMAGYTDYDLLTSPIPPAPCVSLYSGIRSMNLQKLTGYVPGGSYYAETDAPRIPYGAGTAVLRTTGPGSGPYIEAPLLTLYDLNRGYVRISQKATQGLPMYGIDLGGIDIIVPSVVSQMRYFFSTIAPTLSSDGDGYALSQISYDPIPSDYGVLSLSPLLFRSDGNGIGVGWGDESISVYYSYQGSARAVTIRTTPREFPFSSFQLHVPTMDDYSAAVHALMGMAIYPQQFSRGQFASALTTIGA